MMARWTFTRKYQRGEFAAWRKAETAPLQPPVPPANVATPAIPASSADRAEDNQSDERN